MVTLETADKALKSVYLGVVTQQLNTNANPLLAKINQSTSNVWGKEVRKVITVGINGGVGAGDETGALPLASSTDYFEFVAPLKNLYGRIEISDKAMRASLNSAGAFVNLLNAEMENLIKASSFNLGRMLYGDGTGLLCQSTEDPSQETDTVKVDSTRNVIEGMIVDILDGNELTMFEGYTGVKIVAIDRQKSTITLSKKVTTAQKSMYFYAQNAFKDREITGLGKVLSISSVLYGLDKKKYNWLKPYNKNISTTISDMAIQEAIDTIEETSGSEIDFLVCPSEVKRAYQSYLSTFRRNVDVMNLEGGYKAISYNGIPLVSDRFAAKQALYLLNTKEFTLHQLCDWQWLEGDDGRIIKQNPGYPTYSATLVKYAELICDKPCGQGMISGITLE